MKAASYRRLRQPSARFAQTDREERLTWSTSENFSSAGNVFVSSNIAMVHDIARSNTCKSWTR